MVVISGAGNTTLTLSRVIMPWDWIGMVTIRSDTRRSTSDDGDNQDFHEERVPPGLIPE